MSSAKIHLTQRQLEMHVWVINTAATDALMLRHQAISINSADWIANALDTFDAKIWYT